VIEDNVDAANSLRDVLALDGHEVAVAHDGPTGLALARELRPDVVFCDIGLPGMDGYAVARAMRADPDLADAVLVAVSGYAQLEDRQKAEEAGFARHLAKPPTLATLRRALGW
jgi:two-component system CheB/CheR fusion protein